MSNVWLADWIFSYKVKKVTLEYIAKDVVTPEKDFSELQQEKTYRNRALRKILASHKDGYILKEIKFTKKIN